MWHFFIFIQILILHHNNHRSFSATELSILLTSCLNAIKNHANKYCQTVYVRNHCKKSILFY